MVKLPERIFKYVNSERIDILEKLLIRFTQPLCFNDPFEMRIPIEGYTPEKIDAQKLPPDCIKRVVVGYNMDYLNRKRVVDAIKANSKLRHIKIEESVLHLDLFSLEYQPLPPIY
jgi:hypothetical protein